MGFVFAVPAQAQIRSAKPLAPVVAELQDAVPMRWIVNTGGLGPAEPTSAQLQKQIQTAVGVPVRVLRPMLQPGSVLVEFQDVPKLGRLQSAQAVMQALNALPGVRFASPDLPLRRTAVPTPNDPVYSSNQAIYMDSNAYASLGMRGVWQQTRGSSGVVLAVLDSGVLFNHPELRGRLLPGYDFVSRATPPTGQTETGRVLDNGSNDGDGRDPDPSDPGDAPPPGFACTDGSTDSSFHGTAVASVAAAQSNNGTFLTGMDWNAKVLPVRVSGRCGIATSADIVDAFYWASGSGRVDPMIGFNPNPAKVINLSFSTNTPLLGGGGCTGSAAASLRQAIGDAVALGVSVVISAGNNQGGAVEFPASCPGAIAASAALSTGQLATYTAKGSTAEGALTIAAPGDANGRYAGASNPGLPNGQPNNNAHSAALFAGTSFSAPMVAGTISLLKAVRPTLSPAEVANLLRSSARAYPANADFTGTLLGGVRRTACTPASCGAGLLDPLQALLQARALPSAPPVANVPQSMASTANGGLSLDASLSTNSNGGTANLSFAWQQVFGNPLALAGTTSSTVQVLGGLNNNIAELQLTVTDTATNRSNTGLVRLVGTGANEQTFTQGGGGPPVAGSGGTSTGASETAGGSASSGGGPNTGGGGGGSLAWLGLLALAGLVGGWRLR
ncbi:S8 family serine peptidase [Limnobacter sp.]|uniref:S8 family serine peptidase n=1 Tax=Limnobacter sp. TaxID=2003368 RepID=UPI003515BF35